MKRLQMLLRMITVFLFLLPLQAFGMSPRPPVVETGDEPRVVTIYTNEYIDNDGDAVHTSPGDYVITNNGVLLATGDGIEAEGSGNTIVNGPLSAEAAEDDYAFNITAQGTAILTYDDATIVNSGPITAVGEGIDAGTDAVIVNSGLIEAGQNGIVADDNATVTNEGFIAAGIDGIRVGANSTVVNTEAGEIFSDRTTLNGGAICGIEAGDGSDITNDGFILSQYASGITIYNDTVVNNNGTITALVNGINAEDNNTITNTGSIGGDGDSMSFESAYLDETITLNPVSNGIVAGDFNSITNIGAIYAENRGIAAGSSNSIVNNGEIYSDLASMVFTTGIHAEDFNTVENNGLIDSELGAGIGVGSNNTVTNNGTVNASEVSAANGIDAENDNTLSNTGELNAIGPYGGMDGDAHSHGIHVLSGNTVNNSGVISASTAGIEGFGDNNQITNAAAGRIVAQDIGISVGNPDQQGELLGNTVINRGIIGVGPDEATDFFFNAPVERGIIAAGPVTVNNSGTIHANYAGIATSGNVDTIVNEEDGTIYVYGTEVFEEAPGIMVSGGDAGISVGNWAMVRVAQMDGDTTLGVGDQAALAAAILNRVTNYGFIEAFYAVDEVTAYGATGIRAGYYTAITNSGVIEAFYDGIETQDYNLIYNAADGVIVSDLGSQMIIGTGIDAGNYNLVTNDGVIDSRSSGIAVDNHNEVINNHLISAVYTGIAGNDFNIITNAINGLIVSDQMDMAETTGISVDSHNLITNAGLIVSEWGAGISGDGSNQIDNSGTIISGSGAATFRDVDADMSGIILYDGGNTVTNLEGGVIQAAAFGIDSRNESGTPNTIANAGWIVGAAYNGGGPAGIRVYADDSVTNTATGIIGADGLDEDDDSDDNDDQERRYYGITGYFDNAITNDGRIDTWSHGIRIDEGNTVINNGEVYSQGRADLAWRDRGAGIIAQDLSGDVPHHDETYAGNTVTNNGLIQSQGDGIVVSYNSTVTNHGLIDTLYNGIVAENGNSITNSVDGIIHSDQHEPIPNASGIHAFDDNTITNAGSITSDASDGINVVDGNTISNSGSINAADVGIYAMSNNRIGNSGLINAANEGIYARDEDGYALDETTGNYDPATVNVVTTTDTSSITGTTAIRMEGAGVIEAAGILNGTEGTAIFTGAGSNQLVTVKSDATIDGNISDDDISADDDELTFDGMGSYDGNVDRFEHIYKTGSGIWQLTGNINLDPDNFTDADYWAATTEISEGTLQIDGNLGSTIVQINEAGILAGEGAIYALFNDTVYNDGTVAPGDARGCVESVDCSIGTLTIVGDFAQRSSGKLAVELIYNGDYSVDQLTVNGIASFTDETGGSVQALPLGYVMTGRYTFLTADVLAVGAAPTLEIAEFALFNVALGYDDEEDEAMWLDVTRNTVREIGGSANDQGLYNALLALAEDGDSAAQEVLDLLDQMATGQQVSEALSSLSPEQYPNLLDLSHSGFGLYQNALLGRMGNLHLAQGRQNIQYASNTLTVEGPTLSRLPNFDNRTAGGWSSWARLLGMTGNQDKNSKNQGFEFDTYGISVGIDKMVSQSCSLGIGGGFASSDVDFDNAGQDTVVDSYHVGIYSTHSTEKYYIDAAILYAHNKYDSDRQPFAGSKVTSNTDGREWGITLGGGFTVLETETIYLIPTAAVDWSQVDIDGFSEKGSNPLRLTVDDYDTDSFTTTLGFRLGGKLGAAVKIEPELRLAWAHEFGDTDRDVTTRFVGTTTTFTSDGVKPEKDSALLSAGVNVFMDEELTLYFDYDGEFRSDFDGHALSGGFRYNF